MLLQRTSHHLNLAIKLYRCDICIKRYKNKNPDHWANKRRKTNPANLALKHFDEFYKKVYKEEWPSIRIALLTQHKYVALVNNFGDTEKTINQLESLGALNITSVYNIHKEKIDEKRKPSTNEKYKEKLLKMTQSIHNDIQEDFEDKSIEAKDNDSVERTSNDENESDRLERRNRLRNQKKNDDEDEYEDRPKTETRRAQSLHESIKEAEIDEERMINASSASGSVLYDFVPATELKGMEDYITERDYIEYYRPGTEVDFKIVPETSLHISPYLNVFSFPKGDINDFPSPKRGTTGVFNYYCMDGGSLLPVLALGIQPYDKVLDMCAAPGGKSLVALQTLYPELIVANDLERSRRLLEVMDQFIYDFNPKTDKRVQITKQNGLNIDEMNTYDKILVDVPCTNDRLSVSDDFNNIFNPMKLKIRLSLPELQSDLLSHALKLVKVGGSVVYSTCSLSPIQNDGVVIMALKKIWEETNHEIEIKDLSVALKPLTSLYSFANIKMSYGHVVKPYLPNNFGPIYFCKLNKIK